MKILLIPFVVLVINQTIKFFILLWRKRKIVGNRIAWSFVWVGQFPSAHSALLLSCDTIVWYYYGISPIFVFCSYVSLILMYNLMAEKKYETLLENYFVKSADKALTREVKDQIVMDYAGHTFMQILAGGILGTVLTLLLLYL